MEGTYQSDLKVFAKAEVQLAERVDGLCRRLDRIEDIGEEDRSELYCILKAIKHDAQSDAATVNELLGLTGQEAANV